MPFVHAKRKARAVAGPSRTCLGTRGCHSRRRCMRIAACDCSAGIVTDAALKAREYAILDTVKQESAVFGTHRRARAAMDVFLLSPFLVFFGVFPRCIRFNFLFSFLFEFFRRFCIYKCCFKIIHTSWKLLFVLVSYCFVCLC